MGIREWANGHPKTVGGVVGGCVLLGIGVAVIEAVSGRHSYRTTLPDQYYTVDDGKTWFAAPSSNEAPFDYKGRVAVRAYVFQCGGKPFVGFLERFNADAKRMLDAGTPVTPDILRFGRDMKRPGDAAWTPVKGIAEASKFEDVKCPAGGGQVPEVVEP